METPEGRELRKQWSTKRRKNAGRPKGTPDGLRKEQADTMREEIKKEAEKVVEIMGIKLMFWMLLGKSYKQSIMSKILIPSTFQCFLAVCILSE